VLAWDLSGGARPGLSERELGQAWEALARPESEDGWRGVWRLAADPKRAVPFLREQLPPVSRPDPARVARLIADLEGRFGVRQRAAEELEGLGEPVVPLLREALGRGPALDTRRRLEAVLEQIEAPALSGTRLQAVRAVEALESMGTAEARRLLERLAAGAAGARLTEEAKASLHRLNAARTLP
jgi:hypothetical protein